VKKIPKLITKYEIMQAYSEGKRGYFDGKRRGYNPYADIEHEELAAAWWRGWDYAQAETQGEGDNAAPAGKDEL
jgi:hypothetical protein